MFFCVITVALAPNYRSCGVAADHVFLRCCRLVGIMIIYYNGFELFMHYQYFLPSTSICTMYVLRNAFNAITVCVYACVHVYICRF